MGVPFADRTAAGRQLGAALRTHVAPGEDAVVLALPRGGVPVAVEVARALGAPLDVLIVRKLGVPGQEELALGAIASGGVRVLNEDVVAHLGISSDTIEAVTARELRELERRETAYRGPGGRPALAGRCVVVVDDGVATGSTLMAALHAVRKAHPARVVAAVPVAPEATVRRLRGLAAEVVCLAMPEPFFSIGQWYLNSSQVDDATVRTLLAQPGS